MPEHSAEHAKRLEAPELPGRGWFRQHWPLLVVLVIVAHSMLLGLSSELIGPNFWDEYKYIARALSGVFDPRVRSRYAHIWSLRIFMEFVPNRQLASALYAVSVNSGLLLLTYGIGRRASGPVAGMVSALCLYGFRPLSMYWTEPLSDPPALLWAGLALLCAFKHRDGGNAYLWSLLCGVLMFISIKCKETGIAVAPAALWVLLQRREHVLKTFVFGALGVLVGQCGLCVLDGVFAGDPWQSLRFSAYRSYVKAVSTVPTAGRRDLARFHWTGQLLSDDLREIVVVGLLGLTVGFRRSETLRVMVVWALFNLFFGAWVCWRYTGIDVVVRYLAPMGPALCVGVGALVVHLGRQVAARVDFSWQVFSGLVAAAAVVIGLTGLKHEWAYVTHAIQRTPPHQPARLFFDLAVPLCLIAAAFLNRKAWRRVPLMIVVLSLMLSGTLMTREFGVRSRKQQQGWAMFSEYVTEQSAYRIALCLPNPDHSSPLDTQIVHWRLAGLGAMPFHAVHVRKVKNPGEARSDELLVMDYGPRHKIEPLAKKSWLQDWQLVTSLRRGGLYSHVYRHKYGFAPGYAASPLDLDILRRHRAIW